MRDLEAIAAEIAEKKAGHRSFPDLAEEVNLGWVYATDRDQIVFALRHLAQLAPSPSNADTIEAHYQAAMAMSEKHRKNWVEACQERDRLAEQLRQAESALDGFINERHL